MPRQFFYIYIYCKKKTTSTSTWNHFNHKLVEIEEKSTTEPALFPRDGVSVNPAGLGPNQGRVQLESHVFLKQSISLLLDSPVLLFHSRLIQRFMSHRLCVGYFVQFRGLCGIILSVYTNHTHIHHSCRIKQKIMDLVC